MDLDQLIRQSLAEIRQEEAAASNAGTTQQPAAPQPITVNIQGQPVTFRDQADLETQLNATALSLRQQSQQPPVAPTVTGTMVDGKDGHQTQSFDNERYIALMNEDPRKATNYALSHLMFDGEVENPAELIRETMISAANANRQLAAYQFRDTHREVPIDDPRVKGVLDNVRTALNLPQTADGIEAAYLYAVNKGQLPNFAALAAQQQQQFLLAQQQQNQGFSGQHEGRYDNAYTVPQQSPQFYQSAPQQPTNPYLQAPPVGGRSAQTNNPLTVGDVEDMSIDQIQKLLQKLGQG